MRFFFKKKKRSRRTNTTRLFILLWSQCSLESKLDFQASIFAYLRKFFILLGFLPTYFLKSGGIFPYFINLSSYFHTTSFVPDYLYLVPSANSPVSSDWLSQAGAALLGLFGNSPGLGPSIKVPGIDECQAVTLNIALLKTWG